MTLPRTPTDVPTLMAGLASSDPGRPRVTWYGHEGERVELSARVLDNWVAKTANLLVDELDADARTTVRLDLQMHWRTAVWALATWAVGARLVEHGEADVAVAAAPALGAPDPARDCDRLVVVALAALAPSVPGLPPGALDYNASVSGFGDVFVPVEPAALPPAVRSWPDGVRLLVTPSAWDLHDAVLAPLLSDGSVVLVAGPVPDSLLTQENVSARA